MLVRLEEVSKRYGRTHALDKVTLEFQPGKIIAVLGANGAGKTSLLNCLASLIAPDHGKILFDGELFRRDRVDLRRRLMFIPDFPVVYGHFDPVRHIAMVLRLYEKDGSGIEDRVVEVLRNLDLLSSVGTPLGKLSRGQIYKSALAAMLVADPDLWVMDEPLASGMDHAGLAFLKQECRAAAGRGRTIIYSTQLLEIAENFSDRVCVLHRGAVQVYEEVEELRTRMARTQGALDEIFRQLRETKA